MTTLPRIQTLAGNIVIELHAADVVNPYDAVTGATTFTIKRNSDNHVETLAAPTGIKAVTLLEGENYQIDYTHSGDANYKGVYDEWAVWSPTPGDPEKELLRDWDGLKTITPIKPGSIYITKIPRIDGEPIIQAPPNIPFTHYFLGIRELRLILGGFNGVLRRYANPLDIFERENTGGAVPIGLARARDAMNFLQEQSRGNLNISYHDATSQLPATNFLETLIDDTNTLPSDAEDPGNSAIMEWGKVWFRSDNRVPGIPISWDGLGEEYLKALTNFQDILIPSPTTPETKIKTSQRFIVFQAIDQTSRVLFSRAGSILYNAWLEFPADTKFWNTADKPA